MFKRLNILTLALALLLTGCTGSPTKGVDSGANDTDNHETKPKTEFVASVPKPKKMDKLPALNPDSYLRMDVYNKDLTDLDLSKEIETLKALNYDTKTLWPKDLPANFDPEKYMTLGKDPGLNIRKLHESGITGKGVSVAVLDGRLLKDHIEYKDQLKYYKVLSNTTNTFHGTAVSSVAVGKNVGIAPDANLYYFETAFLGTSKNDISENLASNIKDIIKFNKTLSADEKIRVLSISIAGSSNEEGYENYINTLKEAKEEGIFVITSQFDISENHIVLGLGREPLSNPNDYKNYKPSHFLQRKLTQSIDAIIQHQEEVSNRNIWIPIDYRCIASGNGKTDYIFTSEGGISWGIPYLAGVYALACQTNPEITQDEFIDYVIATGDDLTYTHEDNDYSIGKIINPVQLITELKGSK